MNKYFSILLFFCFFLPQEGESIVFQEIDTAKPLKVYFSKVHGNRIAVNNGTIKKIIGPPNICSVRIEQDSAQAFINLLKQQKESIVLSVITGNGYVQDLEVIFEDKMSEVVILNETSSKDEKESQNEIFALDIHDNAANIVKELLKKQVPSGFVKKEIKNDLIKESYDPNLRFQTKFLLDGSTERIYIYQIINTGEEQIFIKEKFLKKPNDIWVYLEKEDLKPKEKSFVFICEKKTQDNAADL